MPQNNKGFLKISYLASNSWHLLLRGRSSFIIGASVAFLSAIAVCSLLLWEEIVSTELSKIYITVKCLENPH